VIDKVKGCLEAWCQSRAHPEWYEIFLANYFPPPGTPACDASRPWRDRFGLTRDQVRYALDEVNQQFVDFSAGVCISAAPQCFLFVLSPLLIHLVG